MYVYMYVRVCIYALVMTIRKTTFRLGAGQRGSLAPARHKLTRLLGSGPDGFQNGWLLSGARGYAFLDLPFQDEFA